MGCNIRKITFEGKSKVYIHPKEPWRRCLGTEVKEEHMLLRGCTESGEAKVSSQANYVVDDLEYGIIPYKLIPDEKGHCFIIMT